MPSPIKIAHVRESMAELLALRQRKEDAAYVYAEAVKIKSQEAGLKATVLARYVAAVATVKVEEKRREVQQLELLFADGDHA